MGRHKTSKAIFDYRQMPEVVTTGEAAVYLRVSRPTVTKYAEQGVIPGRKVGDQWRFFRDDLRKFMEERPGYDVQSA